MANLKTDRRATNSISARMKELALAAVNTILPPVCLCCDRAVGSNGSLCGDCWSRLQFIEQPYCPVLGTPFAYNPASQDVTARGDHVSLPVSLAALAEPPTFDHARAVVVYDDVARRLVAGLKFADRAELAPWMAQWMVRAGQDLLAPEAIIVPVPLHRWRMLKRRYNQSAELGRHVAKIGQCEFRPEILKRIRSTKQQVGLRAKERLRNVLGAFQVPADLAIYVRSRHFVLIDDVYTTGATVQACARALRRKGAARVDCLTFARVVDGVAKQDL